MSNPQQNKNDEIDLSQLLALIVNGKWILLSCIVAAVFYSFLYIIVTKPVFLANALIQVEEKQSGLGSFGDLESLMGGESSSATEIEVIKSRFVLGNVVDKQYLQINIEPHYFPIIGEFLAWRYVGEVEGQLNAPYFGLNQFNTGGEYIKISGLYVSEDLASKELLLQKVGANKFELFSPSGNLLVHGEVGIVAKSDDGKTVILVSELNANPGAKFDISISRRIDAINYLRERLIVSEKGRKTGVIFLALEGTDKRKIKDTVNEVAKTYQLQNVKRLSEEAEQSIAFLNVQVPALRVELEAAEQALNDYRSQSNSLDMALETQATLEQIVSIDAQLNELELKESEISSRYKKTHPLYSALLNQKQRLAIEKQRIEQTVENLPATQQELLRLMRNVEVGSEVYLQLLNKVEELKVLRAGTVGNVRILDEADVLTKAVKPKKALTVLLALFLGFGLGLVIVFVKHLLSAGLVNPSELQERLGIANYGVIPLSKTQIELEKNEKNLKIGNGAKILATENEADLALEAIRGIRTSLHFAMMDAKNNIVMLTGPSPGIGKSFVSSNLAALIGTSGQRVLLIDADMRRGHIHKALGISREPGLSDILSKGLALDSSIHNEILPNVDFLSTGSIPPNPSELIMSAVFTQFLEQVKTKYDIVLLDTPPTLAVTDAILVGKQVGTTMIVVRHNVNTLREVTQAKQEMEQLGVSVKGYIYNFMEYETGGYGSYNNRYYNYRYDNVEGEE